MKIKKMFSVTLALALLLSLFAGCTPADVPSTGDPSVDASVTDSNASETAEQSGSFPSTVIGEPAVSMKTILSKMSEEVIKERYNILQVAGGPENYTVDLSMYLVEYAVSPEYWNNVSELNYKGVTSAIDSRYPTIYVPMFGEIADSSGKVLRRVIGHIKLSYDWSLQDYKFGMVLYNLSSESYRDMKEIWFHEEIMDYLTRNKVIPQQIFMIRYPSSLWDMHEKIAVIQTATDTVILDLSNSLQLSESEIKTDRAPAYSISEYSVLRKEVEKEAYKEIVGWEENLAGGNLGSVGILVGILCVIALAACGVLWFLFHRRKAKGTND